MVSEKALVIIRKYEGFRAKAYLCPAGVWTIGYGTTQINGKPVTQGMVISLDTAEKILRAQAQYFEDKVKTLVKVPVNENQLAALTSFAYNVGLDIDVDDIPEGLGDSTLLKKLNKRDYDGAADEFPKWCWANGKQLLGLKRRRAEEKALFEKPM